MIGKGGAILGECSSATTKLFESRYRAAGFVPSISRARRAAASASESRASRKNIADKLAQFGGEKSVVSFQFRTPRQADPEKSSRAAGSSLFVPHLG
jgi:hypothetical protein